MDLVQTVRKEGSRGGRAEFKWDDVKTSAHRENYLGHSVMAPVGRWQRNRDLSWYAKNGDGTQMAEEEARREEIKRIKQQEDEAMAKALGIELPSANANLTTLGVRPGDAHGVANVSDKTQDSQRDSTRERRHERRHRRSSKSRERSHRHRTRSRSPEKRRYSDNQGRRSDHHAYYERRTYDTEGNSARRHRQASRSRDRERHTGARQSPSRSSRRSAR